MPEVQPHSFPRTRLCVLSLVVCSAVTLFSCSKEGFDIESTTIHTPPPDNLSKFVSTSMEEEDSYAAIFLPGGQGALAGLPECLALKELILWACSEDLFILSICHGPAALISASMELQPEEFVFSGYSMAAFPDSVDRMAPMIGYLPGHMPYKFGERLQRLGVTLVNKKADSTCHVDRKLITGASPEAANDFGRLVAQQLLSFYKMDGGT